MSGTVYRYFSSKDHLVAAALLEWARDLEHRTARLGGRAAPPAGTPVERLVAVLDQALRAYERRPVYARLLVMVATSTDANASACFEEMRPCCVRRAGRAIDDVEPDTRHRILMVIGAVWYHCLVEWVNGRMTPADVTSMLETTAHLLLPSAPDGSAQPLPPP